MDGSSGHADTVLTERARCQAVAISNAPRIRSRRAMSALRIPLDSISTAHTIAFFASAAGGLARSRSLRSARSRSFRAFGPSTMGQS